MLTNSFNFCVSPAISNWISSFFWLRPDIHHFISTFIMCLYSEILNLLNILTCWEIAFSALHVEVRLCRFSTVFLTKRYLLHYSEFIAVPIITIHNRTNTMNLHKILFEPPTITENMYMLHIAQTRSSRASASVGETQI